MMTEQPLATLFRIDPFPEGAAEGERYFNALIDANLPITYLHLMRCRDESRVMTFATVAPDLVLGRLNEAGINVSPISLRRTVPPVGSIQSIFEFLSVLHENNEIVTALLPVPSNFARLKAVFSPVNAAHRSRVQKLARTKRPNLPWTLKRELDVSLFSFAGPLDLILPRFNGR